jgi:hypothetical protein
MDLSIERSKGIPSNGKEDNVRVIIIVKVVECRGYDVSGETSSFPKAV